MMMGNPTLQAVAGNGALLALGVAMETGSENPVSKAIHKAAALQELPLPDVGPVRNRRGKGVEMTHDEALWRLGTLSYVCDSVPDVLRGAVDAALEAGQTVVGLSRDGVLLTFVSLSDTTRPGMVEAINGLRAAGCEVAILSGDRPETVTRLAQGLDTPASAAKGGMFPD